jgi:PAS domain S-box-containing protein
MKTRKKTARPSPKKAKKRAPRPRHKGEFAALRSELEASATRFSLLLETAAAPIVLLTPELEIFQINSEALAVFGRQRAGLLGRDYFAALHPDRIGGLSHADFKAVLAGQPARGIEGLTRRPDGTTRVLLWNATRLADPRGRILGVIAVAQDVTERHQAEEALREREARLSSIIATAPDAIVTIDERGTIQSFSVAAERLFGYDAGEVIGRNIKLLMPTPYRENHDGYLARYRRTGEKHIIGTGREVAAQRKDGTVFPMELAVGEVKVGTTRIFTGFVRDLSARVRIEAELRQAQKMEAIGQLTGGLAHDFNNLLTVIIGNLEMLERRVATPSERELVGEAQEAAELGAKLSSRLLAFGRRQALSPKAIQLSALVEGMTDLLRRTLGETVRIETVLEPGLPLTMADPGQVENALLNLAINARDAMSKGGRLTIETGTIFLDAEDAIYSAILPGNYLTLAVTDTGTGMAPEVVERAFEPFFTTKEVGVGSGLGLSMVYGFVRQSGGSVRLESEVGRGTTVRIFLPVAVADTGSGASEVPRGEASKSHRGKETLLVVEDDARVRRVSVRRLRELGYTVIEVESGPAALEVLDLEAPVDLLFTDVVMPGGMTGLELARVARERRPGLPILFTSGYADPEAVERDFPSSNAGWLPKPYPMKDLEAKLRELLDR